MPVDRREDSLAFDRYYSQRLRGATRGELRNAAVDQLRTVLSSLVLAIQASWTDMRTGRHAPGACHTAVYGPVR